MRNNGDGTFTKVVLTGTEANSRAVSWGDYDNDGDLDQAVVTLNQTNRVYRNDGSGTSFTVNDA